MSAYTITMLCSALWYMCVLLTWVHINQTFKLFSDHTPHGWLMIFLAFLASLTLNFVLNPLMWTVAGCYIHQAKKENRASKWQFYPGLIGVLLLVAAVGAVVVNLRGPSQLLAKVTAPRVEASSGPVSPAARKAPQVSGIMFSSDPKVLIDGDVIRQGEEIDGFVVDEIKENSVVFLAPDGSQIVRRVR